MRYKIVIEYNGSNFSGWQRQKHTSNSIQELIENAVYKFSHQKVNIVVGGRTDAGVHALGQVAHFDLSVDLKEYVVRNAINWHLRPHPITILLVEKESDDFHARFSAKKRHYKYRIVNRYSHLTFDYNFAWHVPGQLCVDSMQKAANLLVGRHDFSSFRARGCQATKVVRTIDSMSIIKKGDNIDIFISALSFLYNQVRIMVGTLVECGKGKFSSEYITSIIEAKSRSLAGVTAPPYGLYLLKIDY